ncbi:unnamed protein product [Clonostachys solani]|uniref:Zn(2)-C6 fungal-type domain-containing protein n=1 Tax=Clonostachys solani TaxID=160281 RepID=A0A9N9ZJA1_9HYPO|nr:unnamed protein product [Clonostachys solani]
MASAFKLDGQGSAHGNTSTPSPQMHHLDSPSNATVYQTTGPDAHTSPLLATDGSGPAMNPRSCVTCRRRKVRCDKQMPCSNCRRALIPCVFPAPGRAPRQPRPRDPNAPPKNTSQREAELVKRLRKLEGIVEELSGQIDFEGVAKASSPGESPEASNPGAAGVRRTSSNIQGSISRRSTEKNAPGSSGSGPSPKDTDSVSDMGSDAAHKRDVSQQLGRLVLNDHKGSTRYVSYGFWSKLNDELESLRNDYQKVTDEESDYSDYEETPVHSPEGPPGSSGDHHAFIFGYKSADVDLRGCHPLPSHIPYLWSVFRENVDPLIKILHVPTGEEILRDARKNPSILSPGNAALVFAIYYSAVVSMEPDEVRTNFNSEKDDLLKRYRFALEQSLAKADFLNSSELVVLQAFTIFITVVRRFDRSRFCWTLLALLIRIAHGMGLHRDGSQLGLTPFETEMRRRLWWGILALDLRSAEELGTELSISETSYDTQLFLNINDSDIHPAMKEPPAPREGRTDTSTVLTRYEMMVLTRRLFTDIPSKNNQISHADLVNMQTQLYQRIKERYLSHAKGDSDPLWWMGATVIRIIMAKMRLFMYQQSMFPGADAGLSCDIRQSIYLASIEILELSEKLDSDAKCKQYKWLFLTYSNWFCLAFNLIETCRRPWTPLVERAWEIVTHFDNDSIHFTKNPGHSAILLPMHKLFARAKRHRAAELARFQANPEEARHLDFEEQLHPTDSRFGPIPGYETRMDDVRQRWWFMISPEGGKLPSVEQIRAAAQAADDGTQPQPLTDPTRTTDMFQQNEIPGNLEFPDEAMGIMDEIMSQPNLPLSALWPLHEIGGAVKSQLGSSLAADPSAVNQQMANNSLSQEVLSLKQQAAARKESTHVPPYLWTGTYDYPAQTVTTANMPSTQPVDMEMLDAGFDWRDWGQNLHNLDMSGMP